ncbi:MAG: cbb3-type cytochrome c oxidase subunit 3 [Proteobacteria bacterium]|nr:cbb3-type cytochrome c oxidase subunit 3 [Pseudomonadota bacterium]
MSFDHGMLVGFAKSYGLFYLLGLSVAVLIYTYWPSNRARFDRAAKSVLNDEDGPWQ